MVEKNRVFQRKNVQALIFFQDSTIFKLNNFKKLKLNSLMCSSITIQYKLIQKFGSAIQLTRNDEIRSHLLALQLKVTNIPKYTQIFVLFFVRQ